MLDFTSVSNTFGQFTGASSITAGNGVSVNGDTISVNSDLSHVTNVGTLSGLTSNGDVDIAEHNGVDKGLKLNSTLVTATAGEINKLSGVTATTDNLNILSGLTATTAELEKLSGMTSTKTELNYLTNSTPNVINNNGAVVYGSAGEITASQLTFSGATMKGHIIPDADVSYDVEAPERKIRDIYISMMDLV